MTLTRKTAAGCAIAALILPAAATAAFAFPPADPSAGRSAVSLVVDPQSYTVASAAQEQTLSRAAFEVYTPPAPPAAPAVAEAPASSATAASVSAAPQSFSGEAVVAYAETFVGVVPYGWGADPSDSFGCDGLVQYVFGHFGISLPRGADNQAALGTVISADEARAGDLVWWPGRHIGIWDGAGGIIDSPDWGRYVEHHAPWASSGPPIYIRL
ncbi:NlpC/P60 family protein [Microbacterium sp.]|uniref:C40 family peptidase n=1 Tax=Microbacterium sp. TaxID=51671 RepID=UPI001AC4A91E|nr:NlpC/P60 family protein [Microbacterium sp.]MBN9159265.1 C40 family peptidase [Microbacterium sp.]MBS1900161.1 C40 family peptidase [Actinomycetota bacterium]